VRKLFLQPLVSMDGNFDGPNQEIDGDVVDDEFLASMPWTIVGLPTENVGFGNTVDRPQAIDLGWPSGRILHGS
jgi:hypothetical protein